MLQRAASNAYSWWWASHIRTKQGKWLDQNLKDMEERVKNILQIIEEDADSFAKRAEMYYKKRPELINFVEESYRAYRALAERYEHISRELHNANNTIASVCPDQVELAMEEDGDDDQENENPPKSPPPDPGKIPKPLPENPKFNLKSGASSKDSKSALPPKPKKPHPTKTVSQKNKAEAQEKIDKLQKGILVLQTEKEFVKSSYESGVAKYWDIENQITEMQEEICSLQDEFSVDADDTLIEDNEARALMTAMALKSCKDTLVHLRGRHKTLTGEARVESQRIKDAEERLNALKDGSLQHQTEKDKPPDSTTDNLEGDVCVLKQEGLELQSICEKIKEYFEMNSNSSTTVTELAEKVDELVTVVLGLETTVSSHTAVIERVRSESDELQKHLITLEEEKMSSNDGTKDWSSLVEELEEELHGVQDLNRSIESGNNALQTKFTEVCCSFDGIFEKIQSPKQKDMVDTGEITGSCEAEKGVSLNSDSQQEQTQGVTVASSNHLVNSVDKIGKPEEEDSPDWQQLFLNGLEDREKVLLTEYTSILRNYKETKRRLSEMEKTSKETLAKVTELKSSNVSKDLEIQSLRQKLGNPQASSDANSSSDSTEPDVTEAKDSAVNGSKSSDSDAKSIDHRNHKILEELLYEKNGEFTANGIKHIPSTIEEKFRRDIDQLLEENLQFWLRFSSLFHQIEKFQKVVPELQSELLKMRKDSKKQEGSIGSSDQSSAEAGPINKQAKELRTEMFVWLEQNALLKEELRCRLSSLVNMQEEISRTLGTCSESEQAEFTPYQAAKFQGEILNMQQENNKVAEELQAGLEQVRKLQSEVEKLSKTHGNGELSGSKNSHHRYHHIRYSTSRSKIPLRSFIFGVKAKKHLMAVSGENRREAPKGDLENTSTKE